MGGSELGIGAHVVAVVRAKHCDVVAPHSGTGAAQLLLHAPPAPPPPQPPGHRNFRLRVERKEDTRHPSAWPASLSSLTSIPLVRGAPLLAGLASWTFSLPLLFISHLCASCWAPEPSLQVRSLAICQGLVQVPPSCPSLTEKAVGL